MKKFVLPILVATTIYAHAGDGLEVMQPDWGHQDIFAKLQKVADAHEKGEMTDDVSGITESKVACLERNSEGYVIMPPRFKFSPDIPLEKRQNAMDLYAKLKNETPEDRFNKVTSTLKDCKHHLRTRVFTMRDEKNDLNFASFRIDTIDIQSFAHAFPKPENAKTKLPKSEFDYDFDAFAEEVSKRGPTERIVDLKKIPGTDNFRLTKEILFHGEGIEFKGRPSLGKLLRQTKVEDDYADVYQLGAKISVTLTPEETIEIMKNRTPSLKEETLTLSAFRVHALLKLQPS